MKITRIEKKSKTRYTVDVDGSYYYIFDEEILSRNGIQVGSEVDEALLDRLKAEAEERRARERALYLLSYRDHSRKELYDKLCKNVSARVAAKTVARLEEAGLLSDETYARKLAEYYLTQKNWSVRKAVFEMARKGVDRETAEAALYECEVDPKEQIRNLIEQKYYRSLGDFKGNQKVIAALMRLGFQYGDIKAVISEYDEEEEEDQWQYE